MEPVYIMLQVLGGVSLLFGLLIWGGLKYSDTTEKSLREKPISGHWQHPNVSKLDRGQFQLLRLAPHANWVNLTFDVLDETNAIIGEVDIKMMRGYSTIRYGDSEIQCHHHGKSWGDDKGGRLKCSLLFKTQKGDILGEIGLETVFPLFQPIQPIYLGTEHYTLQPPRPLSSVQKPTNIFDSSGGLIARFWYSGQVNFFLLAVRRDCPPLLTQMLLRRALTHR